MTFTLTKDEPLDLTKNTPLATKLEIGSGWKFKVGEGFDLDLFAVSVKKNGKKNIGYFAHKEILNGAITLDKDNRDGKGQGIDEFINLDLSKVPEDVEKITFYLSSFVDTHNFDLIEEEFLQIKNPTTGEIIAKTENIEGSGKTITFCEFKKEGTNWVVETLNTYNPLSFVPFVRDVLGFPLGGSPVRVIQD